jgi:hypothetical protein
MPAVSRLDAKLSFTDRHGTGKPLPILHQLSVTEWFGPHTVQVADGVSEQSLTALGTGGLTTITVLEITSDRNISITYGAAGSNAPVNLDANGVHAMSGTSLTALAVSNSSGATALVTYSLGGS